MLLIYPTALANTRLESCRTLVSVQTLAVTPEDPLLSRKRIRHTSLSGYFPSFLKGISKVPRTWCHLLQALQEFNLLFSRAGASKVEDLVTGLGNTLLTLLALFFCFSFMAESPFPQHPAPDHTHHQAKSEPEAYLIFLRLVGDVIQTGGSQVSVSHGWAACKNNVDTS